MYINLHKTQKKLKRGQLELLVALKQVDIEYLLKELTEGDLSSFEALEFISRVKVKKKDEHPYTSLRLSPKGKEFLVGCSFEGAPDEQTEVIVNWLVGIYKKKSGGIVKNKKEIARRIHWFKTVTGITGNYLGILLSNFINDTYDSTTGDSVQEFMERNPRGVLSNMLDNVCWTPPNIMAKHYTLADSPLYTYYQDNEEYIKDLWEKLLDENGNKKT